jgi:dolichol kinase
MLFFLLPVLGMIPLYVLAFMGAYMVYRKTTLAELARKIIHLLAILISISHFFVFSSPWQSYITGMVFFIFLIVIRFVKPGFFLFRIKRKSLGDLFLLLGLGVPLLFGRQEVGISITAMLVMGISDSLGALVGQRGKRIIIAYNQKTMGGITAFFVSALLLLFTGSGVCAGTFSPALLLIVVLTALVVTLVEAVSTSGIDNLLIPLAVFILLKSGLEKGVLFTLSLSGFAVLSPVLVGAFILFRRYKNRVKNET